MPVGVGHDVQQFLPVVHLLEGQMLHGSPGDDHAVEAAVADLAEGLVETLHQVLHPDCRLFRGFDDDFPAPHSRHTEVRAEDVRRTPNLRILAESDEAGLTLVESLDHSQVFMTGHLEYDRGTLDAEYRRDLARGMNPHVPSHYYPNDDPSQLPRMNWRAHAHLFYNNWLNYYVYQETPYDFVMQSQNS